MFFSQDGNLEFASCLHPPLRAQPGAATSAVPAGL
jgi:hypothetical protein